MRVLISGASIAGLVLAFWLSRAGFEVTVVERAPALRKTGGHAVDLFRPAMQVSEKMGVAQHVEALATGTTRMTLYREGGRRPARIDVGKLYRAASDRHVEIMRDDLSEIYYDAASGEAEYLFGESIAGISPEGDVSFEHTAPRRFDIVVGADGLHSNVRRLIFGDDMSLVRYLGAYLAVVSAPKTAVTAHDMVLHVGVGRVAGIYSADHLDDARAVFLFRSAAELDYHYKDIPRQKELLRAAYVGFHPQVDEWLGALDDTPAFYFDSITQLRLHTWSRGRVTLVGDAGYCPGPAVGGSTSLAVIGAYVLAGELAQAGGDHDRAFAAYERQMAEMVRRSRVFALGAARTIVPRSRAGVWALTGGARLVSALPAGVTRAVAKGNSKSLRLHDSMTFRDYAIAAR